MRFGGGRVGIAPCVWSFDIHTWLTETAAHRGGTGSGIMLTNPRAAIRGWASHHLSGVLSSSLRAVSLRIMTTATKSVIRQWGRVRPLQ